MRGKKISPLPWSQNIIVICFFVLLLNSSSERLYHNPPSNSTSTTFIAASIEAILCLVIVTAVTLVIGNNDRRLVSVSSYPQGVEENEMTLPSKTQKKTSAFHYSLLPRRDGPVLSMATGHL